MKITMTAIIERQRARLYTKKAKTLRNVFIYKKPGTFQKAKQPLQDLHSIFEVGIYIQKHDTFRYMTILYKKI